jgi:hypothetical protein
MHRTWPEYPIDGPSLGLGHYAGILRKLTAYSLDPFSRLDESRGLGSPACIIPNRVAYDQQVRAEDYSTHASCLIPHAF